MNPGKPVFNNHRRNKQQCITSQQLLDIGFSALTDQSVPDQHHSRRCHAEVKEADDHLYCPDRCHRNMGHQPDEHSIKRRMKIPYFVCIKLILKIKAYVPQASSSDEQCDQSHKHPHKLWQITVYSLIQVLFPLKHVASSCISDNKK